MWRDVEAICQADRMSGTDGEAAAIKYVCDELERAGVPFTVEAFDAYLSYPGPARLSVVAGGESREFNCITPSFGAVTPPGGITVGMVAADRPGWQAQAPGRAVLWDMIPMPEDLREIEQAGGIAQICISPTEQLHDIIVTDIWGTPTPDDLSDLPGIPVVTVSHDDGQELKQLADIGATVKIVAEPWYGWKRLLLPVARIGRAGADIVVLGGHLDSWHMGTTDNATGNACCLELARVLAGHADRLERQVWITWWPGHSTGRYAGSAWFADRFWLDLERQGIAYFNVDSPGVRGADRLCMRHTMAEARPLVQTSVSAATGIDLEASRPVPARVADQSFWSVGLSSAAVYCMLPENHPDYRDYTGGSGHGWWWHTPHDTLDKADPNILHRDTRAIGLVTLRLAAESIIPLDLRLTVAEMREVLIERQQECGDRFDLQPVVIQLDNLNRLMARFYEDMGEMPREQVNRLIKRLARLLVPLYFSSGDRYGQDRDTPLGLFPGLDRVSKLDNSEQSRFLLVSLVRHRNRAVHALSQAVDLLDNAMRNGGTANV